MSHTGSVGSDRRIIIVIICRKRRTFINPWPTTTENIFLVSVIIYCVLGSSSDALNQEDVEFILKRL